MSSDEESESRPSIIGLMSPSEFQPYDMTGHYLRFTALDAPAPPPDSLGPWPDLPADEFVTTSEAPMIRPTAIEGGPVRARLARLNISKAEWDAAPSTARKTIRDALQVVDEIELMTQALFNPKNGLVNHDQCARGPLEQRIGDSIASRGLQFLNEMVKRAAELARSARGVPATARRLALPLVYASQVDEIERLVDAAQAALKNRRSTTSEQWRRDQVAAINGVLGVETGRALLLRDLIVYLKKTAREAAITIVGRAHGIAEDDLRRGTHRTPDDRANRQSPEQDPENRR